MTIVLNSRRQESPDTVFPFEAGARNRLLSSLPQDEFSRLAPHLKEIPLECAFASIVIRVSRAS